MDEAKNISDAKIVTTGRLLAQIHNSETDGAAKKRLQQEAVLASGAPKPSATGFRTCVEGYHRCYRSLAVPDCDRLQMKYTDNLAAWKGMCCFDPEKTIPKKELYAFCAVMLSQYAWITEKRFAKDSLVPVENRIALRVRLANILKECTQAFFNLASQGLCDGETVDMSALARWESPNFRGMNQTNVTVSKAEGYTWGIFFGRKAIVVFREVQLELPNDKSIRMGEGTAVDWVRKCMENAAPSACDDDMMSDMLHYAHKVLTAHLPADHPSVQKLHEEMAMLPGGAESCATAVEIEAVRPDEPACAICMNAAKAVRFGCCHVACCAACAQRVTQCPVCQAEVTDQTPSIV